MRHSSFRHPVAVLRKIIGMPQPDFSRLVGIAESTLAKIESLRLPLSKENAIRITEQTGVSTRWLMAGDPMAAPIADEFRFSSADKKSVPFSAKIFDECRAQIEARHFPNVDVRVPDLELQSMAAGAKRRGQQRMFSYKLNTAVAKLAEEFPIDGKEIERREQRVFRLRELEYELVRAKRYVVRAARQLTDKKDEELRPLFRYLVEYGRAIGGIHPHDLPADMRRARKPGQQEQRNVLTSKGPRQGLAKNRRPSA